MRIGRRPSGGVSITEMSRTPARLICRVRGIGVADIESTSTLSFSWRRSSFCRTPKRCSSSTTSSPRSAARTSRESSRWVPIRMSTLPSAKRGQRRPDLGGLAQARDHLDLDRELGEALPEGAEVLLRQDRGRHQHHHLLAVGDGLLGGAQRDLGLAVADVAADQAVHGALGLHVRLHRVDRLELVGGLPIGEGALEHQLPLAVGRERVAPASAALRVEVEQLSRQLARGAAGPGLDSLPARRPSAESCGGSPPVPT